ncbi:hypothetical protein MKY30_23805 [Oceanobacillus sp. FSL W8-0428]|uniref:hypothetical protein n=1 Tax=Oceanobacillus sp. FSL W8-0428 TaxID=2921715 RepID=UPI0030F4BB05
MKWEYKTYTWKSAYVYNRYKTLENDLNALGEEGWEVVSSNAVDYRGGKVVEQVDEIVYLLKRKTMDIS